MIVFCRKTEMQRFVIVSFEGYEPRMALKLLRNRRKRSVFEIPKGQILFVHHGRNIFERFGRRADLQTNNQRVIAAAPRSFYFGVPG